MERDNPTSHTYFSQRLRLHYLDWGNDSAESMMLVHGIHDHCHTWDWVAQAFRDQYHIVAPDFRGHGDSEWSKGSAYTHLEYVYDVAQLVRQQELAPTTVVAHSLGGTIAAMYSGIFPELVKRLVIVEGVGLYPGRYSGDPAARLGQWVDSNYSLAGRIPRRYESLEDAFQRMQETNPHLTPQQARHLTIHGSNQNEDGTYTWKFDNYTRAHTPYDIPSEDIIDLWKRIRCPVLIINSKQGYPHRIGQAGTLEHFGDVRLIEIDEAGHWTHHDQLDDFVELVADFLGG